jgi:hypothetical protein
MGVTTADAPAARPPSGTRGGAGIRVTIALAMLVASAMLRAEAQSRAPRPRLPLEVVPDTLAICRLPSEAAVPAWTSASKRFATISRTPEELSITTVQAIVPPEVRCERDYRALRVRGPLPLDLVGIVAAMADPLARAGLSIFAISTFETDYVLVKARDLDAAVTTLERAGHRVSR